MIKLTRISLFILFFTYINVKALFAQTTRNTGTATELTNAITNSAKWKWKRNFCSSTWVG
jgi:hypothetical protein